MSRINSQDPQMDQGAHVPNHHSSFSMGNNQFITCRFGEYVPFFAFDSYEKDKIRQRSITTTRSLSLKAPLMEDINLKRDYLQVYYDALLPINWDKCYVRPKRGDIVQWAECSTNVSGFPQKIANLVLAYFGSLDFEQNFDLLKTLSCLTFVEMFYSDGALINHFGCHMSPLMFVNYYPAEGTSVTTTQVTTNFDKFFDNFCQFILNILGQYPSTYLRFQVGSGDEGFTQSVTDAITFRQMLTYLREDSVTALYTNIDSQYFEDYFRNVSLNPGSAAGWSFNLAPLWAYQISCAHFYSDDNVDYIFSAELFRSLVSSFWRRYTSLDSLDVFVYNGIEYQYDYLSAHYFNQWCNQFVSNPNSWVYSIPYFRIIFGFNRSLRYQDYFAGARTNPIAVGDETEIAVNNSKVSVINVTQAIQWQRLLNNIQRLPQEIGRFIQASTGKQQSFDYHNPGWLAHTKDTVFAAEVENTGSAQVSQPNSVTATLRGKSSAQEFTFDSDRPCIIIGIQYFDIRRAYYTGVRRTLQLDSREDMFMPELQYIGDQPIHQNELVSSAEGVRNFGYTEQYNWLKTNYDEAMGGFVNDSLPGWSFLFRPEFFAVNARGDIVVSPNFIRSLAPELDEFFLSLTGFSLGTYFHFQQKVVNVTSASRNMVRHSQILG